MMWKHWVVFFVLLILALLTRFWGLGDFDVSPDEYHFIGDAFRLFNNDPFMNARHHPFSHGVPFIGHPFLAQDLMVLFFRLFGPSVWAGRAVMAFANILTIMGVYLLGRWWISKKAGLLAMFLIIILPLDVRYARDAHLDSLLAANLTWATIALDRLLSTKRIFWAVIFGFFSALTIATKINGPILFLYDGAIFLLLFLFKKGMDLRAHIHHVLFASFIFALVAFLLVDPSAYLDGLLHPSDPVASTAIPWFFQGGWYHFVWLHLIPHFYTI
ncbi:MAG: glycosyltransferase family 39 protein, partial [bacterium]|nr:glycosyltransferase family 39 protein [bacterium]